MDFILDILIDFYNALGMPYKFVKLFLTGYEKSVQTSYIPTEEELRSLIKSFPSFLSEISRRKTVDSLLLIPKNQKNDVMGWSVVGLNKNCKYKYHFSIFNEESMIDDLAKRLKGRNIYIQDLSRYLNSL